MTSTDRPIDKLAVASPDAAREALEQADEYDSLFGSTPLLLDDGSTIDIPPHPQYGMIDDDRLVEWEEHQFRIDTEYEREPDVYIPEQKMRNADGLELTMPAETKRGNLRIPFRTTNAEGKSELVRPPNSIKVVMIALGEDQYRRLREGGRNAGDVWKIWTKQGIKMAERSQRDSKSAASTVDLAPVSSTDS